MSNPDLRLKVITFITNQLQKIAKRNDQITSDDQFVITASLSSGKQKSQEPKVLPVSQVRDPIPRLSPS
jgi:hypothetical protein